MAKIHHSRPFVIILALYVIIALSCVFIGVVNIRTMYSQAALAAPPPSLPTTIGHIIERGETEVVDGGRNRPTHPECAPTAAYFVKRSLHFASASFQSINLCSLAIGDKVSVSYSPSHPGFGTIDLRQWAPIPGPLAWLRAFLYLKGLVVVTVLVLGLLFYKIRTFRAKR